MADSRRFPPVSGDRGLTPCPIYAAWDQTSPGRGLTSHRLGVRPPRQGQTSPARVRPPPPRVRPPTALGSDLPAGVRPLRLGSDLARPGVRPPHRGQTFQIAGQVERLVDPCLFTV
ncbi:MAG: hypothetical protein LBL19_02220 [Spirochaetaceae bacterium]|nr:hypothetical protein [Spirochaetaceae bacterium]